MTDTNHEIAILQKARHLFEASYRISNPPPKFVPPPMPLSVLFVLLMGLVASFLQGTRTFDIFFHVVSLSVSYNEFFAYVEETIKQVFVVVEAILAFLTFETVSAALPFLYGKDQSGVDMKSALFLPAVLSIVTAIAAGLRQSLNLLQESWIHQFVDISLVFLIGVGVVFIQVSVWHLAGVLLREYYRNVEAARLAFTDDMKKWEERMNASWQVTKSKWVGRVTDSPMQKPAATAGVSTPEPTPRKLPRRNLGVREALKEFERVVGRPPVSYEEAREFFSQHNIPVNRASLWRLFKR